MDGAHINTWNIYVLFIFRHDNRTRLCALCRGQNNSNNWPRLFVSIVTLIFATVPTNASLLRAVVFICHLYPEVFHKRGIIKVVNLNQGRLCLLCLQVCNIKRRMLLGSQSHQIKQLTRKSFSHFLLVISCVAVGKQVVPGLNGFWAYFQRF